MKLVNEFTVEAPIEETWATLLDVERVASCLPGASIEPVGEDGSYRGAMRVKVGPVSMAYGGTVRLAEVDVDSHVAVFEAQAKETRGTGTAGATIRNSLSETPGGTRVEVETDLDVTGRPAQFGRGLMEEVATKMLGQFSGRLEKLILEGPPEAGSEPAAAGRTKPAAGPAEDEEVLDLGAAMFGGVGKPLVGGIALALLLAIVGFLFSRRLRRGFTFSVTYRA
jgi:uncharacterized protein